MISEINGLDLSNVNIGSQQVGSAWDDFLSIITPENAVRFIDAYNILAVIQPWGGNPSPDEDDENNLSVLVGNILVDANLTVSETTTIIRMLLLNNIIDNLVKIGIDFDDDSINENHFDLLYNLYDLIFVLFEYEDLQSISTILEFTDNDPKDRLLEVLCKVKGYEDSYIEPLQYLITEVDESLMETLRSSLIHPDAEPEVHPKIKERIINNKSFLLDQTLGGEHIKNNGSIGMGFVALLGFYNRELEHYLENNKLEYLRAVLSLLIISGYNNVTIHKKMVQYVAENCDNIDEVIDGENLIKLVVLEGIDNG